MDLKEKKCVPCSSYVPPLTLDEKIEHMKAIDSNWELLKENSRLFKSFKFKNFKKALEFTNIVGLIAESEKHHPEITLGWGYCKIEIYTHTNNDLVENDFILAAKIDQALEKL